MISPWLLTPFVLLLLTIALGPLCVPAWWHRHYSKVCCAIAIFVIAWYVPFPSHHERLWETACQYLSFIILIGALFVVSGGIRVSVEGGSTPLANVVFLFVGALAANLLGAIGASMLLIRPWLHLNQRRAAPHHIAFFIFIVSNIGGCLTPLGPPLFLGYVLGVPFTWTIARCFPAWSVALVLLLALFYILDARLSPDSSGPRSWRCAGLHNLIFLVVIIAAMAVNHPLFLRQGIMIVPALASWLTTRKEIHRANNFQVEPFREVAILFFAIFAAMMPALDYLQTHATASPSASPGSYYFASGLLSSVLDNAPTYLCFLKSISGHTEHIDVKPIIGDPKLAVYLVAISVGSVFFGGLTYIGNAPNLMVKSIADHQKFPTPGFLVYILKFALPFLVPTLIIVWLLFFHGKI